MAPRGRVKEQEQRHDIQITTNVKQQALFPSEMIAKLETTQSTVKQNMNLRHLTPTNN